MRRKHHAKTYRLKITPTDAIVALVSRPGGCTGVEIKRTLGVNRNVPHALARRGIMFDTQREGRTIRYIKVADCLDLACEFAQRQQKVPKGRKAGPLDTLFHEPLTLAQRYAQARKTANGAE